MSAPARAGGVAPTEVIVPAGNTGMGPEKTQFFQALNIQTKITKGTLSPPPQLGPRHSHAIVAHFSRVFLLHPEMHRLSDGLAWFLCVWTNPLMLRQRQ